MKAERARFGRFARDNARFVLIRVAQALGSTPREAGAAMAVSHTDSFGTIGGGQLEFRAIAQARSLLNDPDAHDHIDLPLGPDIAQCCGGRVRLLLSVVDTGRRDGRAEADRFEKELAERERTAPHVYIFGAGHVGRALAEALAPLPLRVILIETRPAMLAQLPADVEGRATALPETDVRSAPPGAAFIILTHDHGLDFLIADAALARKDARYVGMIGSKTKRATYEHHHRREGGDPSALLRLTCPIGGKDVDDKRPAVIAALSAAEIVRAILT